MNVHQERGRHPIVTFLFENSCFLLAGTLLALTWANLDESSYRRLVEFDFQQAMFGQKDHEPASQSPTGATAHHEASPDSTGDENTAAMHGEEHASGASAGHHGVTFHFLVNDVLMALFFAIAAKEVWESLLPGGALSNVRKAATPLLATAGGVIGPAIVYTTGAAITGHLADLGRGWAIPCATDIAFSYLFARMIFGARHSAIAFLLLLAIADDAAGLIILAVFYPTDKVVPSWLLLTAAAIATALVFRKMRVHSFWWYLLVPGTMSWISFYMANIHPALGLVPIIPCMPHAHSDIGMFAKRELGRHDTLSEFEHWWKNPVELILGLFGFVNAGVVFSNVATGTFLVLFGLLIGKPVGITLLTWVAERWLGLEKPTGMNYRHVITLGMVAAIGFTVALFVSVAAFPQPGPVQDSVKMGALFSFSAAFLAWIVGRLLGIRPQALAAPQTEVIAEESANTESEEVADEQDATSRPDFYSDGCLAGS